MAPRSNDDLLKQVSELIDSKFSERDRKQDQDRKRKEDPWGAISDLIDERMEAARQRDIEKEEPPERKPTARENMANADDPISKLFGQFVGGDK